MKDHRKKLIAVIMTMIITICQGYPAFAAETPTINLGTFKNTYTEPTDEWLDRDWEYKMETVYDLLSGNEPRVYLVLYKYNGTDTDLVIPGKAKYKNKEYQIALGTSDPDTLQKKSAFRDNTTIRSIKFLPVDGVKVAISPGGDGSELFKGMTALERLECNNGLEMAFDISGMFEGCTKLKSVEFSGFDTSRCWNTSNTFNGCTALTSVSLGNIDLGNVNKAEGMFMDCSSLESIDLSKASWNSDITNTARMFANDTALKEIKTGSDFNAGSKMNDMFTTDVDTILKIKGSPSSTFLNKVTPEFENYNRYLGEVDVKAAVTLSGNTLKKDMFTFKLYKNSVVSANLITTVKNDANGNISFGKQKIRDISKKVKLIAVQEEVENITNTTGNLTSEKTITIKPDGSLSAE